MKTRILALTVCVVTFVIASCVASAANIIINPSDDGSIYDNGNVSKSAYLMAAGYIRGVVEFPISAIDGQIQNATLSVNPYGLPLWGPVVSVYGYSSNDGRLTSSDYDAGAFLGNWSLPNLGYGQDTYFDVTTFLKTVTTPYVGFNLRTPSGADVFSSLEHNYGHPAQLSVVVPEPAAPTANAGADQTVYAWIDGIAEVTLDGSDSNDADGDELTYKWTWAIDSNTYEANSVSPTIELPIGVHTIQLVVNDGYADSLPDDVNVTVVAPLEGNLKITPQTINRKSNQPDIRASIKLPGNITKNDVDLSEPLVLYPAGIKAARQSISAGSGISAFFDKAALMAAVPDGNVELKVGGKLKSGQYFYGCDTVKVIK